MKKISRKSITAGLAVVTLGGALVAGGTAVAIGAGDDSGASARGLAVPSAQAVADDHGRRHGAHGADDTGFDDRGARAVSLRPAGTARVDVPGPCDEAEHANDSRCTGVTVAGADDDGRFDDHGGRGSDDVGFDDHGGRGRD
jgi:hypothetical protein